MSTLPPGMPPPEPEPSSFRLAITLGIAGLLSGLVLVGIYLGTLPAIQANQANALQAAIFRVVPGAKSYEAMAVKDGKLAVDPAAKGKPPAPGEVIYACKDASGQPAGYAIPARGNGFMDNIGLIFGYKADTKRIVGMEVLESRETPGLGDKILFDPHFLANFESLAVEPEILPVKKGAKTKQWEVDCITGATISSKAVVSILNDGVKTWKPHLGPVASADAEAPK